MKLTKRKFENMKRRARKAHACQEDMRKINRLTVEQFTAHCLFHRWMRWYHSEVLNFRRHPDFEDSIMDNSFTSYCYAIWTVKGRWKRFETRCLRAINSGNPHASILMWWKDYMREFDLELVDA